MDGAPDDATSNDRPRTWAGWQQLAGPYTDTAGAARRLGCEAGDVVERVACRELLAVTVTGGEYPWVFPTRQFPVVEAMPRLLASAGYRPQREWAGWQIAWWLALVDPSVSSDSPYDALGAGRVDEVLTWTVLVRPPSEGPPDLLERIQDFLAKYPTEPPTADPQARRALRGAADELLRRALELPPPSRR